MKTNFPPQNVGSYASYIQKAIMSIMVFKAGKRLGQERAWKTIITMLSSSCAVGGKIIFIGNGGSAAIASHMAQDFSKIAKLRAICFNDGPLLTCLANDYSFEDVFAKAIEMHANEHDVLVAISSSGQSGDILNGVTAASKKGCKVITLSGFDSANPLVALGDLNIYVPIPRPLYGPVELSHELILHYLLDRISNPA